MKKLLILLIFIAISGTIGCSSVEDKETKIADDAKEPATIVFTPEVSENIIEDFSNTETTPTLTGTWVTGSMGYEYYGISQPEYYVQFTDTDINYLHMKNEELVIDHSNKIILLEEPSPGIYIIQAETENGNQYTYKTATNDRNMLNYYYTWNEDEFPKKYSAGASLTKID